MTFGGVGASGEFRTINHDGNIFREDYEEARGDVSGVVDNLLVIRLRGRPLSPLAPISGDVLAWNGTTWIPTDAEILASGFHNLLSPTHPDTTPSSPIVGDLITASGVPTTWTRFPVGSPYQKLRVTASSGIIWSHDPLLIVTSGAIVNLATGNHKVVINKTVGSDTDVNLPPSPYLGQEIIIKDGKGDSNTNRIFVQSSGTTIDGFTGIIMKRKYQSHTYMWNGTEWNII